MRYGLNTKRLRRTLHTVVFDIDSSLAAVPADFFGLCRKLARNRSTLSSAVNGWPLDFCFHRHPLSVNCLYHVQMVLSVGGSLAYFARNARCTVTTDLLLWYSNPQNNFSPGAAILLLHTLASPSGRNVNYDEKNLLGKTFFSCSCYLYRFRKHVSFGFLIINFCNPGVHYEMLFICISRSRIMLEVTEGRCPWRHIWKNISQLGIHICTVRRFCHVFMFFYRN
jgi:hypothetical protein